MITDGRHAHRPQTLIECKLADAEIAKGLRYLKTRFPQAEAFQISLAYRLFFTVDPPPPRDWREVGLGRGIDLPTRARP